MIYSSEQSETGMATPLLLMIILTGAIMCELLLEVGKLSYVAIKVNHVAQSAALAGAVAYEKKLLTEAKELSLTPTVVPTGPPLPSPAAPCSSPVSLTPEQKAALKKRAYDTSVSTITKVIHDSDAEIVSGPDVSDTEVKVTAKITYQSPFSWSGNHLDIVRTGQAKIVYSLTKPNVDPTCTP